MRSTAIDRTQSHRQTTRDDNLLTHLFLHTIAFAFSYAAAHAG